MRTEDRIRAAYENLAHRARDVNPTDALGRVKGAPSRPGAFPALAAALSVSLLIGAVALAGLFREQPTPIGPLTITTTTSTTADVLPDGTTVPEAIPPVGRFRVNQGLVAADPDPFLNVREGPGTEFPILAKLPPSYTGIAWSGVEETVGDSEWWEIALLDPVTVAGPLDGSTAVGWIHSRYVEPLTDGIPVGAEELVPCSGESSSIAGDGGIGYIYSLEAARLNSNCLRIVIGVADGDAPYLWDQVGPETIRLGAAPQYREERFLGTFALMLPDTGSVWMGATESNGVYAVRHFDRSISIVYPGEVASSTVREVDGWLVVDLETTGAGFPGDSRIRLTGNPRVGPGRVSIMGIGRPYEATIGVRLLDEAGNGTEGVFSGGFPGTVLASEYGVMTTDWTEAWGQFTLEIAGLVPGNYVVQLSEGGIERPPLEIPFVVTEASSSFTVPSAEGNRIGSALANFAVSGYQSEDLVFAPVVLVRLGFNESKTLTAAQAADRSNWVIDADEYQGFAGPFDVLDSVRTWPSYRISEGLMNHCVDPPHLFWETVLAPPQINLEPIGIDSCIGWYGLVLRVDSAGSIQEVVLDLYGP